MSEYHVGCGLAGIYAGKLNPKNKYEWKEKSEVTEEATTAVVQYYKEELEARDKISYSTKYKFPDGTIVKLEISIIGYEGE